VGEHLAVSGDITSGLIRNGRFEVTDAPGLGVSIVD